MVSPPIGKDQAARQPVVDAAFDQLCCTVDRLRHRTQVLCERLAPIMLPSEDCKASNPRECYTVPLAERLYAQVLRTDEVVDVLDDILRRLEV
jgi:hypothetical protein